MAGDVTRALQAHNPSVLPASRHSPQPRFPYPPSALPPAPQWLLLYGGDPTTPAKPNVGVLVRLLAERWGCPVLAPIIDTRATGSSSCGQPPLQQPLQPASSQAHLTYYYV